MYIVQNSRGTKEYKEENGMNEVLLPRDSIITPLVFYYNQSRSATFCFRERSLSVNQTCMHNVSMGKHIMSSKEHNLVRWLYKQLRIRYSIGNRKNVFSLHRPVSTHQF